jgi:hypothetical protein
MTVSLEGFPARHTHETYLDCGEEARGRGDHYLAVVVINEVGGYAFQAPGYPSAQAQLDRWDEDLALFEPVRQRLLRRVTWLVLHPIVWFYEQQGPFYAQIAPPERGLPSWVNSQLVPDTWVQDPPIVRPLVDMRSELLQSRYRLQLPNYRLYAATLDVSGSISRADYRQAEFADIDDLMPAVSAHRIIDEGSEAWIRWFRAMGLWILDQIEP